MGPVRTWLSRAALLPVRGIGRRRLERARGLTGWLGGPLRLLMRRRATVVRRNLELCFPQLDAAARREIERAHFDNLAEALAEIAHAWEYPRPLTDSVGTVGGLEHFERAKRGGQGVLLLTGHVTCLELGARILQRCVHGHGIYRPLANPVFEHYQNRCRARYADGMIAHRDLRAMIRHLRDGGVLWYAPDQDPGPRRSRFVPFFGIPAATSTGMLELARLGRARVVPMYPLKDPATGRVTVLLNEAFDAFPSSDPLADLARYNAFLEGCIRQHPAQYWWLHRRFKTRPAGLPQAYA